MEWVLKIPYFSKKKDLPYGSFQHRNVMASFMATGIGICLFLLTEDSLIQSLNHKRYLIYIVTLFSSILIIALQSSTGILGFLITIILQFHRIKIQKKIFQNFLFLMFLGLFIGYISPKIAPNLDLNLLNPDNLEYILITSKNLKVKNLITNKT